MIYWIRHCSTTGQEPEAPLTAEGFAQALQLANVLTTFGIARILSSPYRRAVQSIEAFALQHAIAIESDDRLRERVLSTIPLDDWKTTLRRTFDDADFAAPGGETSRVAEARALSALEVALADGRTTAIVSHGNLTALLLRRLGWPMDFEASLRLTNPDVFRITRSGNAYDIARLWQ